VADDPEVIEEGETENATTPGREPDGVGEDVPTDTEVLALLVPAEFWAVNWKVIVPVPEGYMFILPEDETGPYPCRFTDVAFITSQLRTVEPPAATADGLAVKERIAGLDVYPE
jgi:hypothetical protein